MLHWSKSTFLILLICLHPTSGLLSEEKSEDPKPGKSDEARQVQIAIPVKQPVKGLHLPFYDLLGKLKMQFDAETANRTSENLVEMTELKIETFDETGRREMLVQFPKGKYDLESGVISSEESVEVRRKDFVLTGIGMEFDTKKKSGRVFKKIRMEIFDRLADTSSSSTKPNGP